MLASFESNEGIGRAAPAGDMSMESPIGDGRHGDRGGFGDGFVPLSVMVMREPARIMAGDATCGAAAAETGLGGAISSVAASTETPLRRFIASGVVDVLGLILLLAMGLTLMSVGIFVPIDDMRRELAGDAGAGDEGMAAAVVSCSPARSRRIFLRLGDSGGLTFSVVKLAAASFGDSATGGLAGEL